MERQSTLGQTGSTVLWQTAVLNCDDDGIKGHGPTVLSASPVVQTILRGTGSPATATRAAGITLINEGFEIEENEARTIMQGTKEISANAQKQESSQTPCLGAPVGLHSQQRRAEGKAQDMTLNLPEAVPGLVTPADNDGGWKIHDWLTDKNSVKDSPTAVVAHLLRKPR